MLGRPLGKYHLQKLLATGGMGEVFLARQEGPASFAKTVVVKRLLRHLAADPAFVKMFLDEARLAALVTHPNVVQIFELGEENGTYFIAMEYVRGRSLRDVGRALPEGRLEPGLAVHVAAQILHGLHAAHTLRGDDGAPLCLVHRDVTPENVLVGFDGAVKLVDFGIAKAASSTSTQRTTLKGKVSYMAPEQFQDRPLDPRTDVFACGILLYELLAGCRPFAGASEAAVMHAILGAEPMPLLERGFGVSPRLSAIVDTALAKDPADRHASAEEMAKELEAWALEEGAAASTTALRDRMRALFGDEPAGGQGAPPASTDPVFTEAAGPSRTVQMTAPMAARPAVLAAPAKTSRAPLFFAGIALAVLGGGAAIAARRSTPHAPVASPEPPASPPLEPAAPPPAAEPAPPPTVSVTTSPPEAKPARRATSAAAPKSAPIATGSLAFRVRPWAEVFVDGRSLGMTPLAPVSLSAGRHVVVLKNKDLGTERRVVADVPANGASTVRVDLFE